MKDKKVNWEFEYNQIKKELKDYKYKVDLIIELDKKVYKKELIKKFNELIDENSVPVMDDEEMQEFVDKNQNTTKYRVVNIDMLRFRINKI
jgi:uncharacterized protein YaaW (UPF0174 family)